MAATSTQDATLALVHEGWNHLMSQRPLAAWGTWQRALRIDPESAAARQALETLASASDLPLAARQSIASASRPARPSGPCGTRCSATARAPSSPMRRTPSGG